MRTKISAIGGALAGTLLLFAGCATKVTPSFRVGPTHPSVPEGPVLALAVNGDQVAAATKEGLFLLTGNGPWVPVIIPGLKAPKKISSLALAEKEIFVGTTGEGLFIFTNGTWEVKTARYGGLPDDSVLAIAVDREDDGLPGRNIWVGTKKGLAVRREGNWELFTPDGSWLSDLSGPFSGDSEKYFVPSGTRIGKAGEDRKTFRPPVTAISVGKSGIVLGSRHSRLAYLEEGRFATTFLDGDREVKSLLYEAEVIWCGTSKGLLWGRLSGKGKARPYPRWRAPVSSRSVLFGGRDARQFTHTFFQVGYNEAHVEDLARDKEGGLWVAYADREGPGIVEGRLHRSGTNETPSTPISGLMRLVSIDDYIASGGQEAYEFYGRKQGVSGIPHALEYAGENRGIWVGTGAVLVNLHR